MHEMDNGSVAVLAKGATPFTVVDDVITNTHQSVPTGSALVLSKNGGPSEWEPTPLPGPPSAPKPEAENLQRSASGDEWEPTRLPRAPKPDRILAAPLSPTEIAAAVELAKQGASIRIQHPQTNELRLSDLAGIPEAARNGGGRLVIELQTHG